MRKGQRKEIIITEQMGWGDETLSIPCFLCQNAHERVRIGAELSELFRRERGNITSDGNTCKIFNHELHEFFRRGGLAEKKFV